MRKKKSTRGKKTPHAKKITRRKKPAPRKKKTRRRKPTLGKSQKTARWIAAEQKGLGPDAGGQSGDIQGLSHVADADSESVEELAEEGQAFEAEVISGVENAPDPDVAEVTTKEVPEDDVPPEYRERE